MHTITTEEKEPWTPKPSGLSEPCRSAVCGGDPFIPDTEYDGASLDFTCDIKQC